jgi:membrane fusion protein
MDKFGPVQTSLVIVLDESSVTARRASRVTEILGAFEPGTPGTSAGSAPRTSATASTNATVSSPAAPAEPAQAASVDESRGGATSIADGAPPSHAVRSTSGLEAAETSGRRQSSVEEGRAPLHFRAQALAARLEAPAIEGLPKIGETRWAALGLMSALVLVLLTIGYFGRIEVTSKALGGLRVGSGPIPILVQSSGRITSLSVQAGDRVLGNQELARIEAKGLSTVVERSSRQVALMRAETEKADRATARLHDSTLEALRRKSALLQKRFALKSAHVASRRSRAAKLRTLAERKLVLESESVQAGEALAVANEELLMLREQVAAVDIELAERQYAFTSRRDDREFEVRRAEVGLAEAEAMAVLSEVRAPEAGRIESLLVTEGQVVQSGTTVAQLVRDGLASTAVVFAPAKDAGFLRTGLSASLEFPSLPVGEFGRAHARVTRVGSHPAIAAEVPATLSADTNGNGTFVRVEVEIIQDEIWKRMLPRLRSGSEVIARLKTRKRRLLSLLFDFVR